jgi:hypothetical protein
MVDPPMQVVPLHSGLLAARCHLELLLLDPDEVTPIARLPVQPASAWSLRRAAAAPSSRSTAAAWSRSPSTQRSGRHSRSARRGANWRTPSGSVTSPKRCPPPSSDRHADPRGGLRVMCVRPIPTFSACCETIAAPQDIRTRRRWLRHASRCHRRRARFAREHGQRLRARHRRRGPSPVGTRGAPQRRTRGTLGGSTLTRWRWPPAPGALSR